MHSSRHLILLMMTVALATVSQSCSSMKVGHLSDDTPSGAIVSRGCQERQAATPDGRHVALARNGLELIDRISGKTLHLDAAPAVAMAWRRDGERLAAGFAGESEQGRLAIYDRTGQLLEVHPVPGRIVTVAWSARDDLLTVSYRLQEFSFGANLTQWLVRIDGRQREEFKLWDTTLKPGSAKRLRESLPGLLQVFFSPAGDELVLLRLHDPPQFPAYLQLVYRNWQVPTERKLLDLPAQPVKIEWINPGETLACQVGDTGLRQIELWPVSTASPFPASRGSAGQLHSKDDHRVWTLRKWRFEGLITPGEFRTATEGMRP